MIPQIRTLQAVIACGSIKKGAALRGIAAHTALAQLRQLEKETGCSLFSVHHDILELNEAGIYFYQKTASLVQAFDKIAETTRQISGQEDASLRIGYDSTLFFSLLEKCSARFSENHLPPVRFVFSSSDLIWDQLRHNQIDLALLEERSDIQAPYHIQPAAQTRRLGCVHASHPLHGKKEADIRSLSAWPCILCEPMQDPQKIQAWLKVHKITSPCVVTESIESLDSLLEEKQGYLLRDVLRPSDNPDGVPLLEGGIPLSTRFSFVWKQDNETSWNQQLIGYFQEELKALLS